MKACMAQRAFYTPQELETHWSVTNDKIRQWLTGGLLQTHIWLPVMSVFRAEGGTLKLCHWEGHAPISRHACYRLFKSGHSHMREFICHQSGTHYKVPDTADSILVQVEDLVVLPESKGAFEAEHRLEAPGNQISFDPSFRTVKLEGIKYKFGPKQSNVLRLLYEAVLDGEPWQQGKHLLREAQSECVSLSNLFKRNPVWRKIIQSDERGYYRIDEDILQ